MPSHLLKSSPVDTTPPVVVLPPNIVEIEVHGVMEHVDINYQFPVIHQEEDPDTNKEDDLDAPLGLQSVALDQSLVPVVVTPTKGGKRGNKLVKRSIKKLESGKNGDSTKVPTRKSIKQYHSEIKKLPEALFKIIDDYVLEDAPQRSNNAYIRYIERTSEELAEIVEYDLDEEDFAWLEMVNERRAKDSLQPVQPEIMEFIMDKLEKESYFQMQSSGMEQGPIIDDDAVCCICMDGECQNANAILFCDMCNLAVHQECYGVPYIPEGQWLCRRCLLSPSIAVDCVLCPNKGGAFKETECKRWAHVVCAIWIPEVCFSNTVFLEPIDNVGSIPQARWRLQCFICKQKNVGACIQCYKSNCYTAFHVTCAQQAGLCMRMETVRLSSGVTVKKTAWCDLHAPPDFIAERDSGSSTARQKLKQIRKMLAEKRCAPPVLSIPTIPADQMTEILSAVSFTRKKEFVKVLSSYWKLKRMSRNGVPLLRRLQVASNTGSMKSSRKLDASQAEANMQNYAEIMRLRQDLERGRLLCELTRKREKLKREQIYTTCQEWDVRIQPFNYFLSSIVEDLSSKDTQEIFTQPVDTEQVPDYLTVVENPMDLSTMRKKVFEFSYQKIEDLEVDFKLMINNCLLYNSADTVFYRFALKMQEYGGIVFREAKRKYEVIGFEEAGTMSLNPPSQYLERSDIVGDANLTAEIDNVLIDKSRFNLSFEEHQKILEHLLDMSVHLNHPIARRKRYLKIKSEMNRLKKKKKMLLGGASLAVGGDASSVDEDEIAPSPSLFGFESSDAGEEGEVILNPCRSPKLVTALRRQLRSTDMSAEQPNQLRLSRRLSRSSEATSMSQLVPSHNPNLSLVSGTNTSISSVTIDPTPRKRGRPPKAVNQRGRGRYLRVATRGSPSPLRQRTFTGPPRRGSGRGRPGRPRGRRIIRPVRRSDRVVKQQLLAQQQHSSSPGKEGQTESQRELRRGSPQARNTSPRQMSGSGSRHTSPIHSTQKVPTHRNISPILGSPVKSQQRLETNRQLSPTLGSPVKPHQLRGGVRQIYAELGSSIGTTQVRNVVTYRHAQPSRPSPPKSRPTRERAAKVIQSNNVGNAPINTLASKSMEAAAKSIVCEEKFPKRQIISGPNVSVTSSVKLKRIHGASSKNIATRGAMANQVARRNTLNNADSTVFPVTPRKIKGPAGAVGKRKKSVGEMNGPSLPCMNINKEDSEKRKFIFPPTNGLPLASSTTAPTRHLVATAMATSKKRPRRRSTTISLVPNQPTGAVSYNNILSESSPAPLYHTSPNLHQKKIDSFSVYRSGGNHDIHSGEEYDSEESSTSEEEEEDTDDVSDGLEEKSESDDDDEDEDKERTKPFEGKGEDEEEESEEENSSDDAQEGDSSDSDNSSDSDSDSSSNSSSSLSSTNNSGSSSASSSSITTPRHLYPNAKKVRRKSNQKQVSSQTTCVSAKPTTSSSPQHSTGVRTVVQHQISPSMANNNNNNVLCSNKEIEKDRRQSRLNEQRSGNMHIESIRRVGLDVSISSITTSNGSSSIIHHTK